MCRFFLAFILFAASPVSAQFFDMPSFLGEGYFNPPGPITLDTYMFDDAFETANNRTLPAHFLVRVPDRDFISTDFDTRPRGGADAAFVFEAPQLGSFPRTFLEKVQFSSFPFPDFSNAPDLEQAQYDWIVESFEIDYFPTVFGGFRNARIEAIRAVTIGNVPNAVELIGYYSDVAGVRPEDPVIDEMMVRAIVLPAPDGSGGMTLTAQINLDVIPVVDDETLGDTISGRIIDTFLYLSE